jgi:sulfatase modifying factor 1
MGSPRSAVVALALAFTACGGKGTPHRDGGITDMNAPTPAGDLGTIPAAGDLSPAPAGPCPAMMAMVSVADGGVCVDRYEAATVEVVDGGTRPHAYDHPVDGLTVAATVAEGVKPQGYISEVQAAAACGLAGKRLCTLTEWLAACEGPSNFTYPYGNTYIAGACNEGRKTNPVNDCFGTGNVFTYNNMNSACCDDQPMTVAPGGSFPQCVSSWGIYDLHGNLHEWISTKSAANGIFKGGFFVDATLNGPGCHYATTAHAQSYHDYSTGFRCCADPK